MKHARDDYNRIQDPALEDPSLLSEGSTPIGRDEPVFILRGQDEFAGDIVDLYAAKLAEERVIIEYHITDMIMDDVIAEEINELRKKRDNLWQMEILCKKQASEMRLWNKHKIPDVPL